MMEMYRSAFSEPEAERLARETKKKNRSLAIVVLLILLIIAMSGIEDPGGNKTAALDLLRPAAGESPKTIEADISAEYDGYISRQRAQLRILPREITQEEAEECIRILEKKLPDMILGENASLSDIRKDIILPASDPETGAELNWSSSDTRIISREGRVNLVGADAGAVVTLTAHISLESVKDTFHIAVMAGSEIAEESVDAALKDRVAEAVKEASGAREGIVASLPAMTDDGVRLIWTTPARSNGLPAVFGGALIAIFLFSQRYRTVSKNIEKARAEMERDFPDFMQKLGLLLGAGLVITSAMSRIAEDYISTRDIYGRRRLYEELAAAQERINGSGTSLVCEFSELARRSGLRELMRFSSTLADNIDKGSTLLDKLRAESELLWEGRKKRAEKEGRIAETKLIFPMALQILAVIVITVMPAAFEMG